MKRDILNVCIHALCLLIFSVTQNKIKNFVESGTAGAHNYSGALCRQPLLH